MNLYLLLNLMILFKNESEKIGINPIPSVSDANFVCGQLFKFSCKCQPQNEVSPLNLFVTRAMTTSPDPYSFCIKLMPQVLRICFRVRHLIFQ